MSERETWTLERFGHLLCTHMHHNILHPLLSVIQLLIITTNMKLSTVISVATILLEAASSAFSAEVSVCRSSQKHRFVVLIIALVSIIFCLCYLLSYLNLYYSSGLISWVKLNRLYVHFLLGTQPGYSAMGRTLSPTCANGLGNIKAIRFAAQRTMPQNLAQITLDRAPDVEAKSMLLKPI